MRDLITKKYWFSALLFVLLGILMVLGDGESSFVDIVGVAAVIVIIVLATFFRKALRPFPREFIAAWVSLLLYLFAVTPFSMDVGFSIRTSVRYLDAFLVYWAFYVFTDRGEEKFFIRALSIFGGIALIPALLFSFVPALRLNLPLMSLFWSYTGHNHITDVLLFMLLPVLVLVEKLSPFRYWVFALLIMFFAFFQARSALVLAIIASLCFVLTMYKKRISIRALKVIILVSILSITIIIAVPVIQNMYFSQTQQGKSSLTTRIEFYQQALLAIRARPIFGWGPGTYLLLSPRFQSTSDQSTWFAHNYVLETAAETGLVGLGLFMWVLFACCIRPVIRICRAKTTDTTCVAVAGSISLLLLYGLADYPLNYLVIWILFWAACGLLSKYEE